MGLFDNEDEESNDDFIKRLSAQLDSQGPEIDPDSDPLPIEQVVAAPQEPPSTPSVGKSFSMSASDIVRPRPEDVVKQRIADLVKQRQAEREGLVQNVQDTDSSILGNIFAGISGFGAGVRGGDVGSAFKQAKDIQMSKANRALSEFDNKTQLERQRVGDEREDKVFARGERDDARKESDRLTAQQLTAQKRDPASEASKSAQAIIVDQYGFSPEKAASLSYERIQELFPHLRFKMENTFKQQKEDAARADREASREIQREGNEARLALAKAQLGISQSNLNLSQQNAQTNQQNKEEDQERQRKKDAEISDTQLASINAAASVIKSYEDLAKLAKPGVVGVTGALTPGVLDEDKALFNTAYDRAKGSDLKSIFGAITSSDVGLSQSAFPDPLAGEDSFKRNLGKMTTNAKETLKRTLDMLEDNGKDVSAIRKRLGLEPRGKSGGGSGTKPSSNTDPLRGPTAKIPLGAEVRSKSSGKVQVMTASGLRDK